MRSEAHRSDSEGREDADVQIAIVLSLDVFDERVHVVGLHRMVILEDWTFCALSSLYR